MRYLLTDTALFGIDISKHPTDSTQPLMLVIYPQRNFPLEAEILLGTSNTDNLVQKFYKKHLTNVSILEPKNTKMDQNV